MRPIDKGAEPNELGEHRSKSHSSYANYKHKDGLRDALVKEQRGLCCYCMSRIYPERKKMKIEHWRCVSRYPREQLDYGNLLGSCMGGEGERWKYQHCDTRKMDQELLWNPADRDHRLKLRIEYGADGSVRSMDEDFDKQINECLNLNTPFIKNGRKGVLDGVVGWWQRLGGGDSAASQRLEKKILQLTEAAAMHPYGPVAVWWLERRLARTASP